MFSGFEPASKTKDIMDKTEKVDITDIMDHPIYLACLFGTE